MIQDKEYDRLRKSGEEIPSYKTGIWCTNQLIRLLIYFALNEWQVCNDHLHEKKEKTEREIRRTQLKEITYRMLVAPESARNMFGSFSKSRPSLPSLKTVLVTTLALETSAAMKLSSILTCLVFVLRLDWLILSSNLLQR